MVKIKQTNIELTNANEAFVVKKGEKVIKKLSKIDYKSEPLYHIIFENKSFTVALQDGSYFFERKEASLFKAISEVTDDYIKKVLKDNSKKIAKKRKATIKTQNIELSKQED